MKLDYLRVRLRELFVNPQLLKQLAVYKIKEEHLTDDITAEQVTVRLLMRPLNTVMTLQIVLPRLLPDFTELRQYRRS